ncbi:restriction endonuclease subunit S [Empedobacter falsenii]|uniref:restriction endonuclease subunit S n=1 Tax=Empedobacter falsenii TaxID=343874 RepID=UPI00257679FE|nr:restriction endonuclease subunit S [Empedobacter falsenii]MDM1063620.1 restriction endonuclease subunit S [Empedobacter falsenii]
MNKMVKLKELVHIRSGMVVPKTANNDENLLTDAFVRMIGTSDFDDDLNLRTDLEPNVLYKDSITKNYLQFNEILFNAKGKRFFASLFKNQYENTIASAVFLVLTLNTDAVMPEYLVWYLNHPETLKIYKSKQTTQVMPAITKQELGDLDIIIPEYKIQKNIIEIDQLKRDRIRVQKELIQLHENYINAITYKKIKNG